MLSATDRKVFENLSLMDSSCTSTFFASSSPGAGAVPLRGEEGSLREKRDFLKALNVVSASCAGALPATCELDSACSDCCNALASSAVPSHQITSDHITQCVNMCYITDT